MGGCPERWLSVVSAAAGIYCPARISPQRRHGAAYMLREQLGATHVTIEQLHIPGKQPDTCSARRRSNTPQRFEFPAFAVRRRRHFSPTPPSRAPRPLFFPPGTLAMSKRVQRVMVQPINLIFRYLQSVRAGLVELLCAMCGWLFRLHWRRLAGCPGCAAVCRAC